MTPPDFQKVVEKRIERIRSVLGSKQDEYSRGSNPMHNFEVGAEFLDEPPEAYCLQLMTKHLISITDMVLDIQDNDKLAKPEVWEEKIGDAINYLILLEALVTERALKPLPFLYEKGSISPEALKDFQKPGSFVEVKGFGIQKNPYVENKKGIRVYPDWCALWRTCGHSGCEAWRAYEDMGFGCDQPPHARPIGFKR